MGMPAVRTYFDDQESPDLADLRRATIAVFTREEGSGGELNATTYRGPGGRFWTAFSQRNPNYYQPTEDVKLIQKALPELAKRFEGANTLIDLGSGDAFAVENKAMPIFKAIKSMRVYVPIDLAQNLLDRATQVARNLIPGQQVMPIHGDFFKDYVPETNEPINIPVGGKNLGLLLGSTISNIQMQQYAYEDRFPAKQVVTKIQSLAALVSKGSSKKGEHHLMLSWDSNPDLGEAAESYNDENWQNMILTPLYHIEHKLHPVDASQDVSGFNPEKWQYEAVRNHFHHAVQHCIVATEKQQFRIPYPASQNGNGNGNGYKNGKSGHFISVDAGDKFVIVNNVKYPVDLMGDLIKAAGFETHKYGKHRYIRSDENRMVTMTFDI